MNGYLSLDFGTTNFKAILYDNGGTSINVLESHVPTNIDNEFHEQDPSVLLNTAEQLLADQLHFANESNININGIGLSAAMHGLLVIGNNGEPISNLIIWSDKRSLSEINWLKENQLSDKIYNNSGTPVHPMLPISKILWFKNHEQNPSKNAHKFVSYKEWLLYKWFGDYYVDRGIAAASGMYHFSSQDWNKELLSILNIDKKQLGKVVSPRTILTDWSNQLLTKMKTDKLPPVVVGGSDGCLAMLGSGIFEDRLGSVTIGTSGAIRTIGSTPRFDKHQRIFCYPVDESAYVCGTPVNNGGNVVEWLRKQWQMDEDEFWGKFVIALETIDPGSDGLFFIPYMNGERAPFWDASLHAGFLGLSLSHTNSHFIKAVVEGLTFNLAENLDILMEQNNIEALIADGGFVRSPQWVQLLSDVFNKKIYVSDEKSAAARGAALMAKASIEDHNDLSNVFNKPDLREINPSRERGVIYSRLKNQFITGRNQLLESGMLSNSKY